MPPPSTKARCGPTCVYSSRKTPGQNFFCTWDLTRWRSNRRRPNFPNPSTPRTGPPCRMTTSRIGPPPADPCPRRRRTPSSAPSSWETSTRQWSAVSGRGTWPMLSYWLPAEVTTSGSRRKNSFLKWSPKISPSCPSSGPYPKKSLTISWTNQTLPSGTKPWRSSRSTENRTPSRRSVSGSVSALRRRSTSPPRPSATYSASASNGPSDSGCPTSTTPGGTRSHCRPSWRR
mmetsp:Transcript_46903/g.91564  ORF Transcript_46903/g.91564 Transcript_46903/m.91564 type:complete len:231 (+) Transcript_46903:1385-2077(+)